MHSVLSQQQNSHQAIEIGPHTFSETWSLCRTNAVMRLQIQHLHTSQPVQQMLHLRTLSEPSQNPDCVLMLIRLHLASYVLANTAF
jgi:hypothetical protein